jgi:hypothetical protein
VGLAVNGARTIERWGRRGLAIVLVGLAIQIGTALAWSPGAFILSAAVGVPLVVTGAALFGWAVLRGGRPGRAGDGAGAGS